MSFLGRFGTSCNEELRLLKKTQCTWQGTGTLPREIPRPGTRGFFPWANDVGDENPQYTACGRLITEFRPKMPVLTPAGIQEVDNLFFWSVSRTLCNHAKNGINFEGRTPPIIVEECNANGEEPLFRKHVRRDLENLKVTRASLADDNSPEHVRFKRDFLEALGQIRAKRRKTAPWPLWK